MWQALLKNTAVAFVVVIMLMGCSPEYDWRTVNNDEGAYTVTFPAKPTSESRVVNLAGKSLPMRMQAAKVGNTMFAVGVLTLAEDTTPTQSDEIRLALKQALEANLSDAKVSEAPVSGQSAAQPPVPWQGISLVEIGQAKGSTDVKRLRAYLLSKGRFVYQVIVLESLSEKQLSKLNDKTKTSMTEQAEQFLTSFKPF